MPVSCCAHGCTQRFVKGSGVRFFRFPQGEERRFQWRKAMKRADISDPKKLWEPHDHDRLCSLHFITGEPSADVNHPDYAPSLFDFTPKSKLVARLKRYERSMKRKRVLANKEDHPESEEEIYLGMLQKDLNDLRADHIKLQWEHQRVLEENRQLKAKIEAQKFLNANVNNRDITMLTVLAFRTSGEQS